MSSFDDTTDETLAQDPETPREERREPRRRRPPVDVGHLVMGVAFTGLTVVWALVQFDHVDLATHGWVMSLPWLAAGAAGLLATVLRRREPTPDIPDWKQDHRDWKAQFKADQRAYKEQVRRSHQSMKDEIKKMHDWRRWHGGGH